MKANWPVAVVAVLSALAALFFPLTPALPSTVVLAARIGAAIAAVLVAAAIAMWLSVARRTAILVLVGCVVVAVALLLTQLDAQNRCVADNQGVPVIVGTRYTALGEGYRRYTPEESTEDLLLAAGGHPELIWTADSIRACSVLVTWPGLAAIPFLAASAAVLLRRRLYVMAAPAGRHQSPGSAPGASQGTVPIYDAFVSYRHVEPDRTIAQELVETLEGDGLRAAIDVRDFSPNEHFLSEMERCIRQSRFVICVITAHYVQSDHTSEEAIISKTLDLAERRRRLVPLIYERVELPIWLHGLVGIDFTPAARVDPERRLVELLRGTRL